MSLFVSRESWSPDIHYIPVIDGVTLIRFMVYMWFNRVMSWQVNIFTICCKFDFLVFNNWLYIIIIQLILWLYHTMEI